MARRISVKIEPGKIAILFCTTIGVLFFGHCLYLMTRFFYGFDYQHLFQIFNFNEEGNLPTFFSSISMAIASLLLLYISTINRKRKKKNWRYWLGLSIIFFLFAFDEATHFLQIFNEIFWQQYRMPAYIGLAWIIPNFFIFCGITLLLVNFLGSLPTNTVFLFTFSGVIFIIGAIGLKLISAYLWATAGGQDNLIYNLTATFQVLLEMLGIVLFIYSLSNYLKTEIGGKLYLFRK